MVLLTGGELGSMTGTLIDYGAWSRSYGGTGRRIHTRLWLAGWRRKTGEKDTDLTTYVKGSLRLRVSPYGYLLIDTGDEQTIRRLERLLKPLWSHAGGLAYPKTTTHDIIPDDMIPMILADNALGQMHDWMTDETRQGLDAWTRSLITRCAMVERLHPTRIRDEWESTRAALDRDARLIADRADAVFVLSGLYSGAAFLALLLSPAATFLISLEDTWGSFRIAGTVCALIAAILAGFSQWGKHYGP